MMENFNNQKYIYENYASLNENYESFTYTHYLTPDRHLSILNSMGFYEKARVLDIGCASGTLLDILANKYGICGVGMDITPTSLKKSIKNENPNKFVLAKAESIPFKENSFDFVVSFGTFEHLDDVKAAISEVGRVLKKGGKALVWQAVKDHRYSLDWLSKILNPSRHKQIMKNSGHSFDRMLTKKELISVFSDSGLSVERLICHDILFQPMYDYFMIPFMSLFLRRLWSLFRPENKKLGGSAGNENSFSDNRRMLHKYYKMMLSPARVLVRADKILAKFNIGASAYIIVSKS